MRINYDSDIDGQTYTCDVCGYTYNYYFDHNKQANNKEEPFVQLEEYLLRTVRKSWEPERVERISQYACPKCGVLQVDVNSL